MSIFLGISIKVALNYEYIPNLVPIESVKNKHFDYIVIGAGTAGTVLSYKLTKYSNYTVLLVEAGGQNLKEINIFYFKYFFVFINQGIFNWLSVVPLASTLMQGTAMDWKYDK